MIRLHNAVMLGAAAASMHLGLNVQAQAETIQIGLLADMSGVYADISGRGEVVAANLAIQDFLEHTPGWTVKILSDDHQNKPDVASARARQWIDVDGVDMVINGANSATGLAISKVAKEKETVNFDTGAATTRLTNEDCSPYTIQYVYDTYMLSSETGRTLVERGKKKWFFLTVDYAFGHSLEASASNTVVAAQGQVVGSVRHPINASDFSSYLLQAQGSGADVIGLANAGGDTIKAIKTAQEFGLTKSTTLAGLLMFINDVHSLTLPVAQGMYLTTAWYWDTNDETRAFAKRYFAQMQKMPNMAQAGTYSAVMTYLKAVKAAGSKNADTVMKVLRETPIDDVFASGGTIRQDGRMIHDAYLMQVKSPDESKYPWDYFHIVERLPGERVALPLSESKCALVKQ
ncbi:MAG: ABC transporter substrate-binding protein [Pusillimonas sp.]